MPRLVNLQSTELRGKLLASFGFILTCLVCPVAQSDTGLLDRIELFGTFSAEARVFPEEGAFSYQSARRAYGVTGEATLYFESEDGKSFTLTSSLAYDDTDPERTRVDLREAFLLLYGSLGNDEWELRLGVDKVHWGIVESRPLVDIINQTDFIEHPNEKTKMGQLMAHLTWSGGWGAVEFFGMTWHRPRTLPGRFGRFRPRIVVDQDLTSYEASSEEWNIDLAGRYTTSIGLFDFGLSLFDGSNREPTLIPILRDSGFVLAPYYELIRQAGTDIQLIAGSVLLKLEAIHRMGAQNRRFDQDSGFEEEDYTAFILGGERTFNGVWNTNTDITLISEWSYDERGVWATNAFENDILTAARIGLNDEQSTEFFVSVVSSLDTNARIFTSELNRRISDFWSFKVEAMVYSNVEQEDVLYEVRRDSFVAIKLNYNF